MLTIQRSIRRMHSEVSRSSGLVLVICAGSLVAPAGLAPLAPEPVLAQAAERYVVPRAPGVQLRCNPGSAWYSVATLGEDTVLRVVGTAGEGWLEVAYPEGTRAVVKDEEVEVDQATRTATLTRRSRLRAFSPTNPVLDECFKAIFDDFLEPGTKLRIEGRIQNLEGRPAGYVVVAPPGATGFVLASEVREATPAEARALADASPSSASAAADDAPLAPGAASGDEVELADASESASSEPERLVMGQGDAAPSQAADAVPAFERRMDEAQRAPSARPSTQEPAPSRRVSSTPSLKQLDAAFTRMQKMPVSSTDPTELIEQYERYVQRLIDEGAPQRSIDYVDARIQVLRLREELRMTGSRIESLADKVAGVEETYQETIDRLADGREYLVVGRLLPSSLYDGERMPLLYRLTSIDGAAPRTLAYITPEEGLELDSKTGAIVGIIGENSLDRNPSVTIVRPRTVDVLQAARAQRPVTADAAEND